jgi:AhpD family alkylhydroperoxidase
MKRDDIYKEIEQVAGLVPSFLKRLPDFELEHEWRLFRQSLEVEGPIPPKFRELTGLAVASALQCPYCIHAHTQFAKVFGASDAEVEQAAHAGAHTAGWSTYIAGLGTNLEDFKKEIDRVCDHMKKQR